MKLDECIERIEKYMHSSDNHPRLVNVQNFEDMKVICSYFNVGSTVFKDVIDYAKFDENPSESKLFYDLRHITGNVFITGFTTFYKLLGEHELKKLLKNLVSFTCSNIHVIVLCYQCERQLCFDNNPNYNNWIYLVDGDVSDKTNLIFNSFSLPSIVDKNFVVDGIHCVASFIEQNPPSCLYVKTKKNKRDYPHSLIDILEQNAYNMLCSIDARTISLLEHYGTMNQWEYALNKISELSSWDNYAFNAFGGVNFLDSSLSKWETYDNDKKWMLFILLKLFKSSDNSYLSRAVSHSDSPEDIITKIYQELLELPHSINDFWKYYDERKELIQRIGELNIQISEYCSWVLQKGKNAIYYLTDLSSREIKIIFQILNDYQEEFSKDEFIQILKHIYPDLYQYLQPYDYKNKLLNQYFDEYKYQKVTNCVKPNFLDIVEKQAKSRDYNLILPARSEKIESIDMSKTIVYFVDAMGVEYLSFIIAQCRKYNLMAYITLCHCEIPSITCKNKDFVEVFEKHGAVFAKNRNGIKGLDEIKHHGEEDFDYTNNELPTYLAKELQIIANIIKEGASKLQDFEKFVLISDHGASRLSVISKREAKHQMATNGVHSGRCCPKSESDIQPDCAIDGDDFWVLANYDRFKGSRAANVEVHGGATLEEVVIPIIEIKKSSIKYEFKLLTKKITFSKRKKDAQIEIFSKEKIDDILVKIFKLSENVPAYELGENITVSKDGQNFIISIPNLKESGIYSVNIYLQNNLIKSDLRFSADNSDFKEKKLL